MAQIAQGDVISFSQLSFDTANDTIPVRCDTSTYESGGGLVTTGLCSKTGIEIRRNASNGNGALWFHSDNATTHYWKMGPATSHTSSAPKLEFFYYNASDTLTSAGYINASGWHNPSSRAIKTNIANIKLDVDNIFDKLEPVQFTYVKDSGNTLQYGFIYEDLVKLIPAVCDKQSSNPESRGINYSEMVPILVKEIQSLRKRVASLEEALENKE